MPRFSFLILLLLVPLLSSCQKATESEHHHEQSKGQVYTCPMHPEVRKGEPGNCPICGMPLVEEKAGSKEKDHLLPTDYQKKVINYTTSTVEREDVSFRLPVSGRITGREEVTFSVYESDLPFISPGQNFLGKVSGSSLEKKGIITSVDHIADPSSHTVRVVGRVKEGGSLHPMEGSFFGEIRSTKKNVLLIPEEAILHSGKKTIIYLQNEEGSLTPIEVSLGRRVGERVEILSGLEEGDIVAAGPNFLLDSEARLRGIHD